MTKYVKITPTGNTYIVVDETETTITIRKMYNKSKRDFITMNKNYVIRVN